MSYYIITPTDYIDKLVSDELYQKAGAFQNYWMLFYKYYVKDNDITSVADDDLEHFRKRYSQRTLAKVFNVKSKNTATKWKEEFTDVIANFVAHWKLKTQKNLTQDNYTQKQGDHLLTSKYPKSDHEVTTPLTSNETLKSPINTEMEEDEKISNDHLTDQRVTTYCPVSDHEVTKYKTYNNNINNNNINNIKKEKINKKEKKEWLESFLKALTKISKKVYSKRAEFESTFMSLFTQYDDVEEVIEWASKHNFWMDKLIDPRSIRRNFEKMRLQMLKEKSKKPIPNGPDKVEQLKDEIETLKAIYEKKLNEEVA